jgi:hypothetical protein
MKKYRQNFDKEALLEVSWRKRKGTKRLNLDLNG